MVLPKLIIEALHFFTILGPRVVFSSVQRYDVDSRETGNTR